MIIVENLTKTFKNKKNSKVAVNDISFTAHKGEVFGLLGPNGAGKTTALRIIATLLQADGGQVKVDNLNVLNQSRAVRNKIGFLTSEMRLSGRLTPREFLHFFGQLNHIEKKKVVKKIEQLAQDFEFSSHLDMPIAKLSSGISQKVSIAVALLNDPPVIIFDEPTTNLDVIATKIVADFIRMAKEEGKCVLLSTHILSEAQRLCDRVGILHEGKLLCEGPLNTLLEQNKVDDLEQLFFKQINGEGK